MRNFNQGGGSRFGGNRGGGSRFGGGDRRSNDRGQVTMHPAICNKCGKECEVPFRPTGDKPIYCNDCFSANRDRGGSTGSPHGGDRGGDRFPRKDFGGYGSDEIKKQLEFLGLKIDRLTKAVENLSLAKSDPTKEKSAQVKEALKTVKKKAVLPAGRQVKKAKV